MNQALKGLLFKEWKMMRGLLITLYLMAAILLVAISVHTNGSVIDAFVILMGFGFIIIPAFVLYSLNTEVNQMQSFLHNPQSAHKLFLAKVIYSFIISITFMLPVATCMTIAILSTGDMLGFSEVFLYLLATALTILVISLIATAVIMLLWTLHQIWRTYIGGLSILIVIALIIGGNWLFAHPTVTQLVSNLTARGPRVFIPFIQENFEYSFIGNFYLGTYVFYGFVSIGLFFLSAYLFDRKVEA